MRGRIIRIKERPRCTVCDKQINDDFCVVMEPDDAFETCMCLDCKDKLQKKLRRFSPYIEEVIMNDIDDREHMTPEREMDIIESRLAAAWG